MSTRLKDVVDKLYHPSQDARQVFALSRPEAERLPRLPTVAMISITAPERQVAVVDGFEYLLRLSFADVDFLNPQLSRKARQKSSEAFTASQAAQILSFVDGLPSQIRSVVVHCEGGFSRSCAIALALHLRFGYLAEVEQLTKGNPSVLQLMMACRAPSEEKR
ncbi:MULTISPECIES: hypothetical protein [Chromobacterium]|uniref:Tyrosine specific protein phosphatases domain-containing protein n=2 Tax=Chromobacterium TaxID=535 RepID=A0AAD0WB94_9NEIS|nr:MULTISPECIES: hypothetical protein [Chromobacterium]AXT49268.1 hypothetical protein D1345_23045 [Chromobacterium rhizoryzae]